MHYDRLTLHVRPPDGESVVCNYAEPGLHHKNYLGVYWPLMEQWHPVLDSFPMYPPVLDYSAKVCISDCAVVDAAARVFALVRDWIILLVVSSPEEVGLAKSWLCNARLFDGVLNRTLVVSTDLKTVEDLFDWNSDVNVVHWDLVSDTQIPASDDLEGWVPTSNVQSIRLLSVARRILERSIPLMLTEAGCVWTADPFLSLPQGLEWDVAAAWDGGHYLLSLAFLRPSERTCDAMSMIEAMATDEFRDSIHDPSLDMISAVFTEYARFVQDEFLVEGLDPDLHANTLWYKDCGFKLQCVVPLSVCARGVSGNVSNSINTLHKFGHWYLTKDGKECNIYSWDEVRQSVRKWMMCSGLQLDEKLGSEYSLSSSEQHRFPRSLADYATIYSFGNVNDLFFELWLASRYRASIHILSHDWHASEQYQAVADILTTNETTRPLTAPPFLNVTEYRKVISQSRVALGQLHFHGLSDCSEASASGSIAASMKSCTGQAKSSVDMMKKLGHERIDLVKVDVNLAMAELAEILIRRPTYIQLSSDVFATNFGASPPPDYKVVENRGKTITLMLLRLR
jgi:hypothetical protein